jgi:hypothetical protein
MHDSLNFDPFTSFDLFDIHEGLWHRLPLALWDQGVEEITLLVNRRSDWMQPSHAIDFVEPASGWVTVGTARTLGADVLEIQRDTINSIGRTVSDIDLEMFTWEHMEYYATEQYNTA